MNISLPNKRHPLYHIKKWSQAFKTLDGLPWAEQQGLARQLLCNPSRVAPNMLVFVQVFAKTYDTEAFACMLKGFETDKIKGDVGIPNAQRAYRSLKAVLQSYAMSPEGFIQDVTRHLVAQNSSSLGVWCENLIAWGVRSDMLSMSEHALNALTAAGQDIAPVLKQVFTLCGSVSDQVFFDRWAQQNMAVMTELEKFATWGSLVEKFPSLMAKQAKEEMLSALTKHQPPSKPKVM